MEQTAIDRTLSLFAVVSRGLIVGCASPSDEPGPEAPAHGECGGHGEMYESHGHCHCIVERMPKLGSGLPVDVVQEAN